VRIAHKEVRGVYKHSAAGILGFYLESKKDRLRKRLADCKPLGVI